MIVLKRKSYSDGLVFTPPFQPRCSFPYHYLEIVPSCAFITFTLYASTNIATVRISTRSSKLFIRPPRPLLSQTSTSTMSSNLTIGFEAQDFSKYFDLPPLHSLIRFSSSMSKRQDRVNVSVHIWRLSLTGGLLHVTNTQENAR